MRQLLISFIAVVAAGAGCVATTTVECADGRICPEGTVCDLVGGTCVEPGGLSVNTGVIDLGTITCGTSTLIPITVSNFGDEAIAFEATSTLNMLSLEPASAVVPPSGRITVTLTVNATGQSQPVGLMEGAVYFTTPTEVVSRIVSATIVGADVSTSVNALDFGIASLASPPAPRAVTVLNSGNAAIDIAVESPATPFEVQSSTQVRVEPAGSQDIDVAFTPTFTGEFASELSFVYTGALCQRPPEPVRLSGEISDKPLLINTTILDFGTTSCGVAVRTLAATITSNLGEVQTLSFAIEGPDASEYTVPGQVVIQAGSQVVANFVRNAIGQGTPGSHGATVTVNAEPSGESLIIKLEHGVAAPIVSVAPSALELTLGPDTTQEFQLAVGNVGNAEADVTVKPASFKLPDGGTVTFVPDNFSLGQGQQRQVVVKVETFAGRYTFRDEVTVASQGECDGPKAVGLRIVVGD